MINIEENLKQYIKFSERLKLSPEVSYLGNKYREAVIRKKFMGAFSEEEYLYIDENCRPVRDIGIIKNAADLIYYFNIFYGDPKKSLRAAYKSEEEIGRDEAKYEGLIFALNFLTGEGDANAETVKNIITRLPGIRKVNNEMIKEIVGLMEGLEKSGEVFSDKNLEELYPKYIDAMRANFESIKYIEKGKAYYTELKKIVDKKRRKYTIRWNKKLSTPLFDLSYELGYYVKLLSTYDVVLPMNSSQYIKFLKNSLKENIEYKIKRIKQK